MRFDCGETWDEKLARLGNWHEVFTVFPQKVADHDCRYLEWIERKGTWQYSIYGGWWEWEYRALDKKA